MTKHNKGKIYQIEPIQEHDENDKYIGSTTKTYLSERMAQHRYGYNKYKSNNLQRSTLYDIFDKYGIEYCKIILKEEYRCNTKDELLSRESYYVRNELCINKRVEDRTTEETKEHKKEHDKEYYEKNKESILKRQATPVVCECGCTVNHGKMARHKKTKKHIDLMNTISQ
jgi:hypothetical protein